MHRFRTLDIGKDRLRLTVAIAVIVAAGVGTAVVVDVGAIDEVVADFVLLYIRM